MPFEFSDDKNTVVRLVRGDTKVCYHLSKGPTTWILRRHGTGTSYQPGLLDLAHGTSVVEELTLNQVERQTGYSATTTSVVTDSETWDQIIASVDKTGAHADRAAATDMRHLYSVLKDFNSIEVHAALADDTERESVSKRLARRFRASVEQFSFYCNLEEPFCPAERPALARPGYIRKIGTTSTLTGLLCHQCNGSGEVVNAPELSFTYLDRELIPAGITPAIAGQHVDWLLANRADRHPIIAKVNILNDMNPFYALIQLLMLAAELVSIRQARRLKRHYEHLQIPGLAGIEEEALPSVDLYLIHWNYNWNNQLRTELVEVTERLCQRLMKDHAVTPHIRRIASLEAKLSDSGQLSFHKLFGSSRQDS